MVRVVFANTFNALLVRARVVHVLPVSPSDFFIGVQFVSPLVGHEPEMFVARTDQS